MTGVWFIFYRQYFIFHGHPPTELCNYWLHNPSKLSVVKNHASIRQSHSPGRKNLEKVVNVITKSIFQIQGNGDEGKLEKRRGKNKVFSHTSKTDNYLHQYINIK
jgi:hypothetical protein